MVDHVPVGLVRLPGGLELGEQAMDWLYSELSRSSSSRELKYLILGPSRKVVVTMLGTAWCITFEPAESSAPHSRNQ